MNPISGTFRTRAAATRTPSSGCCDFLADEKEIYELFMVVDEELKMMCDICHEGGQVLGPFLKPMSRLVHTEYLLAGRTDRDPREVLRDTMYAATVTGSPVENACRLIKKYETEGRGYYGAALAILGRDAEGGPVAGQPDRDPHRRRRRSTGSLTVTAGATLVRDSDAAYEVAETHAKAGGILSAFGLVAPAPVPDVASPSWSLDEDVLLALNARNQRLSSVLAERPGGVAPRRPRCAGKRVVILDGEDDFVEHAAPRARRPRADVDRRAPRGLPAGLLDGHDLVIVGPGPGDPRDEGPTPRSPSCARRSTSCSAPASRSSPSAWATRRCATGSASRWPSRTSSSRAPSRRSPRTAAPSASASTTRSSAGSAPSRRCPTA